MENKIKNNKFFFFLSILIQIKQVYLGYFDSLTTGILNEEASLIDISDYHNLFPIITTSKKIYLGIPPVFKAETSSKINSFSAAATYNNEYILMACTEDYLLSKIKIETGEETPLINYEKFNSPSCICSISLKDNYVYIAISHIVTSLYQINNRTYNFENDNNFSDLNSEINKIYDYSNEIEENDTDINYNSEGNNNYLENTIIKIKLTNKNENINNPILDDEFNILNYTFDSQHNHLDHLPFPRIFSCEIVNIEENLSEQHRLICGYIDYIIDIIEVNKIFKNATLYFADIFSINSNFNGIEDSKNKSWIDKMPYIRFQRIDSNYIRFLSSFNSYEINIINKESKYIININEKNKPFLGITCSDDLFFYNNYFLFTASHSTILIKKNSSYNFLRIRDKDKDIKKIIGYYESEGDKLLFIYEYNTKKIKYFTIEGMTFLYNIETKAKKIDVISNSITNFNVSELITNPLVHNLKLTLLSLMYYKTTIEYLYEYNKYSFDKETQNLNIQKSLNDWIFFTFYYEETTITDLLTDFFFDNSSVTIRTCLFKCGQCSTDFSICDYGTCKSNFSLLRDSEDKECYPIDQNFPYYIYNKTSNYFEKCYETCIFCSMENSISTKEKQNCKVCKEGYLRSYTIMGNCYPIEYPLNNFNYSIILKEENGEKNFEIINSSCLDIGKLEIYDTGECVESCPLNAVYYTYYENTSYDISKQEETPMGFLYPMEMKNTPKYLFNKVCYSNCPKLTYEYSKNNENVCKCLYGWHRDNISGDIICYDNMNYCSSKEYYYHTDDKECVLNGCKDNYYQINFECYKAKCPENARQISFDIKKCESNLKYCYIDEHFQTQCSNTPKEGYNLKYDITNTYFQSCNDSIYYFNEKTYLYMNTCYINCPEETTKNDTNNRCSCNYYIYYLNAERTDYECLKETEKCWDKKRYNITDRRECVDALNECTEDGYKIFNNECLSECPENSQTKENDDICLCNYNYYNDSNILTCLEEGKSCEDRGFPIKMSNTNECFKNKFECIKRGFKFYDNICYKEQCPEKSIDKNNDGICSCLYYYFNDSNIITCFNEDETCKDKGYLITNIDSKECFTSLEICKNRKIKIFNNNCYDICPDNTISKNGDSSCICAYYFYTEENNFLNCFPSGITCESESLYYPYAIKETKECFKSRVKFFKNSLKFLNFECLLSNNYVYFDEIKKEFLCAMECPSDMPFLKYGSICDWEYDLIELFSNEVKIINTNPNIKDEIFLKIKNELENGKLDNLLSSIVEGENDLIIEANNIIYQIISTNYKKNNENKNISIISLGDCEKKLKEYYSINENEPLIIFKIDVYEEGLLIPIITYEVYNSKTKQKLDISICNDSKIKILLPAKVEEKNIFKHNASDRYYNDICYIYATENGTDLTTTDRKSEYNNKNMSLCEMDCEYKGYNITTKKAQCECKIKEEFSSISEMIKNTEKILSHLTNIKNATNFKIIKCFKNLFTKEGLKSNIGNYILLFIILITIVLLILFFFKGYIFIFNIIEIIVKKKYKKYKKKLKNTNKQINKNNNNNNINNTLIIQNKNIINNPPKKNKKKNYIIEDLSKRISILKTKEDNIKDNSSSKIENKNNLEINQQKEKKLNDENNKYLIKEYNDYELNVINYKRALKKDKRTFSQYYLSLIKRKQIIIFTFYTKDDYNSRYLKICLFFFYFALSYAVNTLFFNDATMHKIYVDLGKYNFLYQLSQILYSTLIINLINSFLSFLSLSETIILQLKQKKGKFIKKKMKKAKKILNIKFIIFSILIIILLIFFWYYISCFCAIYKNTQLHLIKDTLISFGLSILYPFGICLIPAIFRIYSLKSKNQNKECLYKFSKLFVFV